MSAGKAASLTSSLLAPKGGARPAALDHEVYRSVAVPVDPPEPTAVVTALHPTPDDETLPGIEPREGNGAVDGDAPDAAPEAALTDLRVAVEARSAEVPAVEDRHEIEHTVAGGRAALADETDDTAAPDMGPPAADAAEAAAEASETATPVDDESDAEMPPADGAPTPDEPAIAAPADPGPVAEPPDISVEAPKPIAPVQPAPIEVVPTDRLAAAATAAPARWRGRSLLLSGAIFVVSAVIGWYAVQQSPGLQAEFRQLAAQIHALVYGPPADQPASENVDGTTAPAVDPAVPVPLPGNSTVPAERTAPEAAPSDGNVTRPVPGNDASGNGIAPEPTAAPSDKPASPVAAATADADAQTETAPSIDLVRISSDGDGIIVGRAAPDAELILLDNGEPIGTVTATPAGEWVFQTDEPLPGGDHNFAIVVKKTYGNVTLPSAPSRSDGDTPAAAEPAAVEQGSRAGDEDETSELAPGEVDVTPPLPLSKPGIDLSDAAADGRFVIQLASVKSTAHAERLWAELRQDFPDLTDGMKLIMDSRRDRENNAFVRVRTGPFVARANAENYCARFKAGKQDCLVVVALPRS